MSSSIANNIIKTFSESAENRYDKLHSVDLKTASKELLLENAKKRIAFEQSGLERLKYLFDQATGGAFTDSNLAVVKFIDQLFLTKELLQMREKFNQLENQATVKITDEKFKEDFLEFTNSADIYRKQRKEINEMISMGITTVVAVGVSLASSGAATPVILALYTSGASVGTEILVKSIISGEAFDSIEAIKTLPPALVNGVGLGVGNIISKRLTLNLGKSLFAKNLSENLVQSLSGDFIAASANSIPKVYYMYQDGSNISEIAQVFSTLVGTQLILSGATAVGFTGAGSVVRNIANLHPNLPKARAADSIKLFKSELLETTPSKFKNWTDSVSQYFSRRSRASDLRMYRRFDEISAARIKGKDEHTWGSWSSSLDSYAPHMDVESRINLALDKATKAKCNLRVLDIGTGSGSQWMMHGTIDHPHLDLYLTSLSPNFHPRIANHPKLKNQSADPIMLFGQNRAVISDVLNLEKRFKADSFDLIVSRFGMHGDEIAGLKRVYYLLKEGGEAILTFSSNKHISYRRFMRSLDDLLPDTFEVKEVFHKKIGLFKEFWSVRLIKATK